MTRKDTVGVLKAGSLKNCPGSKGKLEEEESTIPESNWAGQAAGNKWAKLTLSNMKNLRGKNNNSASEANIPLLTDKDAEVNLTDKKGSAGSKGIAEKWSQSSSTIANPARQ